MKDQVARKSQLEGRNTSRLPEFTDAEKARIVGKMANTQLKAKFNWLGNPAYNEFF